MGKKWEPFRVGQSLTVLVPQRGGISEHITKVQDVSDQFVIVSAPTQRHRILDIPLGTHLAVLLNEGGKLKNFTSRLERTRLGQVPLWIMSRPEAEVGETQRRDFYRLETFLKMRYTLAHGKALPEDQWHEAAVINLSGGGLGFYSDSQLPIAASLQLQLQLDDQVLTLVGKVVRQEFLLHANRPRYFVGTQFVDINTYQQDTVIKFIFKEQLRLRAKGLM